MERILPAPAGTLAARNCVTKADRLHLRCHGLRCWLSVGKEDRTCRLRHREGLSFRCELCSPKARLSLTFVAKRFVAPRRSPATPLSEDAACGG